MFATFISIGAMITADDIVRAFVVAELPLPASFNLEVKYVLSPISAYYATADMLFTSTTDMAALHARPISVRGFEAGGTTGAVWLSPTPHKQPENSKYSFIFCDYKNVRETGGNYEWKTAIGDTLEEFRKEDVVHAAELDEAVRAARTKAQEETKRQMSTAVAEAKKIVNQRKKLAAFEVTLTPSRPTAIMTHAHAILHAMLTQTLWDTGLGGRGENCSRGDRQGRNFHRRVDVGAGHSQLGGGHLLLRSEGRSRAAHSRRGCNSQRIGDVVGGACDHLQDDLREGGRSATHLPCKGGREAATCEHSGVHDRGWQDLLPKGGNGGSREGRRAALHDTGNEGKREEATASRTRGHTERQEHQYDIASDSWEERQGQIRRLDDGCPACSLPRRIPPKKGTPDGVEEPMDLSEDIIV